MLRVSASYGGHLGHEFDDGPPATTVFAGGCFWGMEALFEHVKGVSSVVSGFSGGSAETAHYKQVIGGTGHAESVNITYDPSQVSYGTTQSVLYGRP